MQVLRAQVASLFANTRSSTIADTVLAWTACAFFYWRLGDPLILVWLVLHFMQLLRYPLLAAYHRDPQAPQRSVFWARRQSRELLIYSGVWGLAPWFLMPSDDLPMTSVMMLLILGLCTGGVPAVAPRWASVLSFVVPMMTGLILALAWRGDETHLFLAVCCAVYLVATLHFAWQQHVVLEQSLRMRFEKDALATRLEQQIELARQASEEKTRFLAAASHDLRQPLHAIALFGAVLEKDLQGRPEYSHAERLMRGVHSLGQSLDTMLDVSRLDAGVVVPELRATPLNTVFQALDQMFSASAESRGLQLRLRASPLWVQTDIALLQRLLANLLENAIKYTNSGGVLVLARVRADVVWIDVRDTGIGIVPEQLDRVFDEFYQIDNPGRDRSMGLGMGLSIVRRLSQLLQHPVHLSSRAGRGSRFRVELQLAQAQPAQAVANPEKTHEDMVLPRHVLLIDDEVDIGDAVAALLRPLGVAVQVVADEAFAIAAFSRAIAQARPFDALVCDYRLRHGIDGLELGQRLITRFNPALPLLLVTGETSPERLLRVRDSGVPVLFKPVAAKDLLIALSQLQRSG